MFGYNDMVENTKDSAYYWRNKKAILQVLVPLVIAKEGPHNLSFKNLARYCSKGQMKYYYVTLIFLLNLNPVCLKKFTKKNAEKKF
ncbi:hypothetical protein BIX54_02955 [Mycoplasmoides pneumoniae]|uniref:Uncharacterized protein n=2 Tax=Mycoplasmoides pneumoniae TaxID=2104 RepID=A0AAP8JFH4_MYCPM|nr:hypothetical protein MPNE_0601 [Mycoplasmoides pneumoniae FH]AJR19074.1 hypothetical protein C985_01260 [Mycoplasmoides pneumoniae M129-B7]ALA30386.1 hypothetical protein C897_02935 [Mycoplasmoides pneumoniae PI 1428]ALA30672.1 hypothetical protein B434_00565 [Mycoplasmoides pneumoniae 19294]ALA31776.1 hypothetical protein F536_02890 [Mycoplasmoides pneumoniae 39443]ALA32492.1 hypothetical protein F533_02935 [Mycoplasmoides pneumoniae 51494]ALA33192.1 hypothetical protein F530_02940 [Mycop